MFCPKCEDEYQDGFKICSKCKEPLIKSRSNEKEAHHSGSDIKDTFYITDDVPALLCTVNNLIEADTIEALMKSNNVPVLKKLRSGGGITMLYMGASCFDTDIYVPSKLVDYAKELLEPDPDNAMADADDDFNKSKKEYEEHRFKRARLCLLLVFGLPMFVALLGVIWAILSSI